MSWPLRLWRFLAWFLWVKSPGGKHAVLRWLIGLILLAVDLTPFMLFYETIMDWIKWNTRPLTKDERDIVKSVFGDYFPVPLISVDSSSFPVKKKWTTAYVSFHCINYFEKIPVPIFVHEMVHIWQYRRYGSTYISEAIWAQKWGGGYDYKGLEALQKYSQGKGLEAFNFEQQADIIEDYYRWKNGLPLQWAVNVPGIGQMLETYAQQVRRR
jgi:hypothetical protein